MSSHILKNQEIVATMRKVWLLASTIKDIIDHNFLPYPTNITENGNRHASGPVHINSVTYIAGPQAGLKPGSSAHQMCLNIVDDLNCLAATALTTTNFKNRYTH